MADPDSGLSQAKIAKRLGVTQPAVGGWLAGHTRPTAQSRAMLAQLFGIPESDWQTAEEVAQVEALREAR